MRGVCRGGMLDIGVGRNGVLGSGVLDGLDCLEFRRCGFRRGHILCGR